MSTSATITIPPSTLNNDRVPAVPSVDEYLKKSENEISDTKIRTRGVSPPSSINEQVSASYTLITPSSFLRTRGGSVGSDDSEKGGKVSVSYTIPVVTASVSEGICVTKSGSKDSLSGKSNESVESSKSSVTTTSVTATFNVPLSNSLATSTRKSNENTSVDVTLLPKSSPTTKNRFKWEPEEKSSTETLSEPTTTKPVPAARFNTDYTTHRSYVRDKRSIFDTDHTNNSTLTLAEKLRIEASKYADTSRSSSDLPFTRSDSAESETTTTTKKYDSVPSSPAHHTTERRPSWRLRLDPNNKV